MTDASVAGTIFVVGMWMLAGAIAGATAHAVAAEIRRRRAIRRLLKSKGADEA